MPDLAGLRRGRIVGTSPAQAVADGSFAGGVYLGTLENEGVGLADVNGAAAELTGELDQLKADIIAGTVTLPE